MSTSRLLVRLAVCSAAILAIIFPIIYSTAQGYATWYRAVSNASCQIDAAMTECTVYKPFGDTQYIAVIGNEGSYAIFPESGQVVERDKPPNAFLIFAVEGDLLKSIVNQPLRPDGNRVSAKTSRNSQEISFIFENRNDKSIHIRIMQE